MRQQQLVEVKGMLGNDYHFTLSRAGQSCWPANVFKSPNTRGRPGFAQGLHAATKAQAAEVRMDRQTLQGRHFRTW